MKRVIVTGGCGFIGSHLVRRLTREGVRVDVFDDLSRGKLGYIREVIDDVNVTQWDLTRWTFFARDYDAVFHLASRVGSISYYLNKPWQVMRDNSLIDFNVLSAAIHAGIPRIFYASSGHVSTSLTYGKAKLYGEQAIQAAQREGHEFSAFIGRIYGAYGPMQDCDPGTGSFIPAFCRRAIEYPSTPFKMQTTGDEKRSYTYIDDVVEAILVGTRAEVDGIYEIGNADTVAMRHVAECIVRASGKNIAIEHEPAEALIPEQKPLGDFLPGWRPKVGLQDGISRCYQSMLDASHHSGY